jgi:hypothetical protein
VAKTLLGWVLAASVGVVAVLSLVGGARSPVMSWLILGLAAGASTVVRAAAYRAGYARGIDDACLTDAALRLLERPRPVNPEPPGPRSGRRPWGREEPPRRQARHHEERVQGD